MNSIDRYLRGNLTAGIPIEGLKDILEAARENRCLVLPCKQYNTVYYIRDGRSYIGWYLAKVGETTHLILTDKVEMGICWITDGYWFHSPEEADAALERRI